MTFIKKSVLSVLAIAAISGIGGGQALAHNLLLVAGNPQVVIFRLSSGDMVVTQVLASSEAGELNEIMPAAGE